MRMKNDFHIKGWAPTLVLKQGPRGTRKWPIHHFLPECIAFNQSALRHEQLKWKHEEIRWLRACIVSCPDSEFVGGKFSTARLEVILGDPGAVSRAGLKGATKLFWSSMGGRGPGYRLSPDHFRTVKRMLAPDWAQKMLCIIGPNRRTASPEFFSWVRTRRLLTRSRLVWLMHQRNARSQQSFNLIKTLHFKIAVVFTLEPK